MKKLVHVIKIPFVYIAIFFLYVVQFVLNVSGMILLFILKLPMIVIQILTSLAITYWIVGQITALITVKKFLPASYFDMSKYPSNVQNAFIIPQGQSILNTYNWYVTPLLVLGIIIIIGVIAINVYPTKNK